VGAGLVVLGLTAASRAYAACSEPERPACAIQTVPFATPGDADNCRLQMLGFRDGMDAFARCAGETSSDDEKQARDRYEDVRLRFNRRARESNFEQDAGARPR
jgi:hypothetical protein